MPQKAQQGLTAIVLMQTSPIQCLHVHARVLCCQSTQYKSLGMIYLFCCVLLSQMSMQKCLPGELLVSQVWILNLSYLNQFAWSSILYLLTHSHSVETLVKVEGLAGLFIWKTLREHDYYFIPRAQEKLFLIPSSQTSITRFSNWRKTLKMFPVLLILQQ